VGAHNQLFPGSLCFFFDEATDLVPRVSHLTAPCSELPPGGGNLRDPGSEVDEAKKCKF